MAAVHGRLCNQKIHKMHFDAVACNGLYMFWRNEDGQQRFGALDDAKAVFVFCTDGQMNPTKLKDMGLAVINELCTIVPCCITIEHSNSTVTV